MNTRVKQERLKNLEMLNVSESLGNKWYRTTKTRAEKSIEKVVKEREKHMKNEDDKDKLVRQIDD